MTREARITAHAPRPFRIAVYPAGVTGWAIPYFRLFHAALAKRGIEVSDDLQIDRLWLEAHADEIDAVHVHWPERIWRRQGFGTLSRFSRAFVASSRLLEVRRFLRTARRLGMLRIWTVHNLEPHEGSFRWDRYGYRLVARESDIVVCHSRSALDSVRRQYPPGGTAIVMPMGEHASEYPAPRPRAEVFRELGLDPELPMVCCLGRLRHYKGVDLACEAIEQLQGRVQLVIGGVRHAGFDLSPILELVRRIPGIVLIDRVLPPQEYADVMGASEAMLLPYRDITGSAALLSALGCGRGVIASDLPFFREILADEPAAGALVRARDARAWSDSILEYLASSSEIRRRAALRLAGRYSWDRCVEPVVAALGIDHQPMLDVEIDALRA